jgi:transposase
VELGIPFQKINPQYTSQECSYCSIIGNRKGDKFVCNNKKCKVYKKDRHADINAAFNVGKRSLEVGGIAHKEQFKEKVEPSKKITLNLSIKESSHA